MVNVEPMKIAKMYEYLSSEKELDFANGALVFGRKDGLVADRTSYLFENGLIDYAVIVGGIGKDSGALGRLRIPEAHYLASLLMDDVVVPSEKLYVDPRPTNGAECCTMGIETLLSNSLPHDGLTLVIHSTSLRRIMAAFQTHASKLGFETKLQGTGTEYSFNSENIVDQKEAVGELLRLADWPAKGWCAAQNDLPEDLVEIARVYDAQWKK